MTLVRQFCVIRNIFINPICGCGVKIHPFINPFCGQMGRPCPDVSKKVCLLIFEIALLTLLMEITPDGGGGLRKNLVKPWA